MTALLVGARSATALVLARALARAGAEVVVADCYPSALAGWSNAVRCSVRLPSPRFAPAAFEDAVQGLVREHHVQHVVPGGEEAFGVARIADLPAKVWTGPAHRLLELHDKARFVESLRRVRVDGVRVPATWPAAEIGAHRDRDLIAKPRDSRFGIGVRLISRGAPTPDLDADDIVQEEVQGEEVCSLSWAVDGRVAAHVAYRPVLRFARGPALLIERVDAPIHAALAEALVAGTGWSGPIAFDTIVEADGQVVPIECNPRITAGVWFLPDIGRLILGDVDRIAPNGDRAMLAIGSVAAGLRTAATRAAWWQAFRTAGDVIWDRADPVPFFAQLNTTPFLWTLARRHGLSLRQATTWLTQPSPP